MPFPFCNDVMTMSIRAKVYFSWFLSFSEALDSSQKRKRGEGKSAHMHRRCLKRYVSAILRDCAAQYKNNLAVPIPPPVYSNFQFSGKRLLAPTTSTRNTTGFTSQFCYLNGLLGSRRYESTAGKDVEVEGDLAENETVGEDGKMEPVGERYWNKELSIAAKPIWLSDHTELTSDEINEFYKKTFDDACNPLAFTQFCDENLGVMRVFLYIPSNKDVMNNPNTKNTRFYVNNVLISNVSDEELLPSYLSIFRVVVHANDLYLTASCHKRRRNVRIIRRYLVIEAYNILMKLTSGVHREEIEKFWENFGRDVKLACINYYPIRNYIAHFLRFFSSHSMDRTISLGEYLGKLKPTQKHIYYIVADSLASARSTPCVQGLIEQDFEVLFLVNPLDEPAVDSLEHYQNVRLVNLGKEILDLDKDKAVEEEFALMCDVMKKQLGDKIKFVTISYHMKTCPCALVFDKPRSTDLGRLRKAPWYEDEDEEDVLEGCTEKVLEINPWDPIIRYVNDAINYYPDHHKTIRIVSLLYDAALISSCFEETEPVSPHRIISELIAMVLDQMHTWERN